MFQSDDYSIILSLDSDTELLALPKFVLYLKEQQSEKFGADALHTGPDIIIEKLVERVKHFSLAETKVYCIHQNPTVVVEDTEKFKRYEFSYYDPKH